MHHLDMNNDSSLNSDQYAHFRNMHIHVEITSGKSDKQIGIEAMN